ncbi:unnamed protein product, partial [Prorocentrum cordatum]
RQQKLRAHIQECQEKAKAFDRQIGEKTKRRDKVLPPGPTCLYFLEMRFFIVLSAVVIVWNMVTMVKEAVEAESADRLFWLDQFFMVFYIVELVLRAALYQGQFLWGSPADVWGNWLDLVVVSSGVLDMYLLPRFEHKRRE